MDRGAWQAIVHEVAKSGTRLKRLSMHALLPYGWLFLIPLFKRCEVSRISEAEKRRPLWYGLCPLSTSSSNII